MNIYDEALAIIIKDYNPHDPTEVKDMGMHEGGITAKVIYHKKEKYWLTNINGRYFYEFQTRSAALTFVSGLMLKMSTLPES